VVRTIEERVGCGKLGSEWSIGTDWQKSARSALPGSAASRSSSRLVSMRNESPPASAGRSHQRKRWSGA
jgi:hypothetical protein